jgi:hypothetical protein
MENTSEKSSPVLDYPSADPRKHWWVDTEPLLLPQTWWTHIAFTILVLVLLWEMRFPPAISGLTLLCVMGIALGTMYWAIRFTLLLAVALTQRMRPHPLKQQWKRWLIIPLMLLFSWWSLRTAWPSRFVFYWHRDEMRRIAEQVLAGQTTVNVPRRVGMYRFDRIGRTAGGSAVSFYESHGSWGFGFFYTPGRTDGDMGGPWSAYSHD